MSIYEAPPRPVEPAEYPKYIHVEGELYVISGFSQHKNLAIEHGILERVEELKMQGSDDVDAGLVEIEGGTITIFEGGSDTLGIPVPGKYNPAKEKTIVAFQQKSPGYEVILMED